jgi:hypothetical protein
MAADGPGLMPSLIIGPTIIFNVVTSKCVDLPGFGNGVPNGPVTQFTCNGSTADNQLFLFDDIGFGDGFFNIRNAKDGLCLDVPGFGSVPSTTSVSEFFCNNGFTDNQLFRLVDRPAGGRWIVNRNSGLCLDVDGFRNGGNDARLTLFPCDDNDDHRWAF